MQRSSVTPKGLALRLFIYFVVLIAVLAMVASLVPRSQDFMPIGGRSVDVPATAQQVFQETFGPDQDTPSPWATRLDAALFLITSLLGTILLMIPITWVYMGVKTQLGYRKAFVEALIVLPICATTVVLLIQDSLALAFGLAALVAAVRFRVKLPDALDGIYEFAAICAGLASASS